MTVLDIVRERLSAGGHDGLVSHYADCGCPVGDLAPCGEIKGDCRAASKIACDGSCGDSLCDGHFVVSATKKTEDDKA
jgi:hypothetical protein